MIKSTRQFVAILKKEGEITEITKEVDPNLELAEIQRQTVANKGKALLFTNVKGTAFPVATNLYGSEKRIELAFSKRPQEVVSGLLRVAQDIFPLSMKKLWQTRSLFFDILKTGTKNSKSAPVLKASLKAADLCRLPQIKGWPEDGGAFITLPLVYTESPVSKKSNLGMYRIQLHDSNTCGMHFQIHRGGGFHYHEAENLNQSLQTHIYIGGPPALTLAAIAPLPENISELLFASLLMGRRLRKTNRKDISSFPILSEADFCITGQIPPHKRMPEGPFGDHYGYYSLKHDYPFMKVQNIFHRKDAIYPATVVGRPPQEDHFITCYLQDLFKPLIQFVMPQVKDVWAYEESGVHSLAGAIVKDRYPREALTTALRILGEGQLSLSKVLMVTDKDCAIKDFKSLLTTVLERIDFSKDIFILSNISQDTLDYTGPKVNEGSKAIFLGVGDKKRDLPTELNETSLEQPFSDPHIFCSGVLAVTGPSYTDDKDCVEVLAKSSFASGWPLVFVFDSAKEAVASTSSFLWHAFTRFEPAADIYAKETENTRYHMSHTPPIIIDCRLKPWYPKVLESNPGVVQKVLDHFGDKIK